MTEEKLGEILRLYSAFGRVAKRSKDKDEDAEPAMGQPFVLFTPDKETLLKADEGKLNKSLTKSTSAVTAEDATYMVIKAVEPLTGISSTRSYFFRAPWKKDDDDEKGEEATGVRHLSEVYTMMIKSTLKAVDIYVNTASPVMARKFVEDEMKHFFVDMRSARHVDDGGWDFRLEGLHQDGSCFSLKEGTGVTQCFKRATMLVYDVTAEGGKNLGSLAFADSFMDSHVKLKDCQGELSPSHACFYLTEGEQLEWIACLYVPHSMRALDSITWYNHLHP